MTPPAKKVVPAKKAIPTLTELTTNSEEDPTTPPITEPDNPPEEIASFSDKPDLDEDENEDIVSDVDDEVRLSEHVVATVPNKTPDELNSETAEETADRYGINTEITDQDDKNPRVDFNKDSLFTQIPSGTHLHPDIAKSTANRGIGTTTENGSVTTVVTSFDYADEAEQDDKGIKNANVNEPMDGRFETVDESVDERP